MNHSKRKSYILKDVIVMWEDAALNTGDYFSHEAVAEQIEPLLCRSVGRCIQDDSSGMVLAGQEFNKGGDPFRCVLRIPRGMVRLVVELQPKLQKLRIKTVGNKVLTRTI